MAGQSSLESLVSIGFMLFLFTSTLAVAYQKERETSRVGEFLANRTDCDAIALEVAAVFTSGEGTRTVRKIGRRAEVYGDAGQIVVGDVFCLTIANVTNGTHSSFTLEEGEVEILSLGREVRVRNV